MALLATLSLIATSSAAMAAGVSLRGAYEAIARASLTLEPARCAAVLVVDRVHALTAAHCVEGRRTTRVTFRDGHSTVARVVDRSEARDLALLRLVEHASATPLALAREHPAKGQRLLFVGRVDRRRPPGLVRVHGLGRCRSLPRVPRAVFTDLDVEPGASGAPLVDRRLRVVGLVHGGARCHIATPVGPVAEAVEAHVRREHQLFRGDGHRRGHAADCRCPRHPRIAHRPPCR
ncbi:MAG: S1 family peptidase [Myxococcota bacterium]